MGGRSAALLLRGLSLTVVAVALGGAAVWILADGDRLSTAVASPTPRASASAAANVPCGRFQDRVDRAESGATLDLTGCVYDAGGTISRPMTVVGGTIHLAAGAKGIEIAASDVTIDGMTILGAQATTFVDGEIALSATGTVAQPIRGLVVRGGEFGTVGNSALWLSHVVDFRLTDNTIHDAVYGGVVILSGSGGRIEGNVVRSIGVVGSDANEGNAYGITITRRSGDLVAEPVSSDITVAGNTIEDVPTWHALDTHAGVDLSFLDNTVRRSSRAIFITSDSSGNRPSDILVSGNRLESPAPVTYNLTAITTYTTDDVTISDNTIIGWPRDRSFTDYQGLSTGLVVKGNVIQP